MCQARKYFSTRQAAERLGISPRTLEGYRRTGEGPVFHRFGGLVRYLKADLDAWAATRRRTSTRDRGGARAAPPREVRRAPRRASVSTRPPAPNSSAARSNRRTITPPAQTKKRRLS